MPRLAVLFFLLTLSLKAQTSTTQISGTVTDSSAAVVPGANVTLTNEATGIVLRQTTTVAGVYVFPAIPGGAYTVRVEAAGFRNAVRSAITVQINTPANIDIQLEVGAATESVQISATSELLQTSSSVLGNVVEQKSIVSLPLNGRNPLNLLMYEPGVVQRSGNTVNVNGARASAVNVTIDGVDANESTNPNPTNNIFRLNPDNVQEFKVTTSNPNAEEGRNSGANVSIATRSGTNQFHGTMFEFFRNTALNSQEFYANAQGSASKPNIQLNQYGFEFGGPIRKNRTFFFGSWQGQKVNFADPVDKAFGDTVDLYAPSALSGIFRYWVANPANPLVVNGQRITQNSGLLVDPKTGQYASGVRNCSGTGDSNCVASFNIFAQDPLLRGLDPAVKAVLGGYPAPNSYNAGDGLNTGILQWNTPAKVRGPQHLLRFDHTVNDKHSIFGRWLSAKQSTLNGDPLNSRPVVIPGFPPRGEVFRPATNVAIGFRSVLSPRLVNELTLGFARWQFLFTQGEANPLFPNTPRFTFNNSDVDYTSNPHTYRAVNTPQIVENVSYLNGKHVMRFGANLRFYQHNDQRGDVGGTSLTPAISLSRTTRPPAGFALPALGTATTPGIAATDLNRLQGAINDLLGIPAGLTQVFMGDLRSDTFLPFKSGEKSVTLWAQGQRAKQYNFFAQDEYKFRRNMTLSYGVRWELNSPPTEAGDRAYVPGKSIDGREGPVTFVHADRWYKNFNAGAFAPRLGITWSPGNSSKTVVRAGYGMAFDALNSFQVTSVSASVPGQTFRCSSQFSGANGALVTTPGCQPVRDIRLGAGFPNEMTPPTVKPSSFLTPPAQVQSTAPPVRVFDQNMRLPTVHMWNVAVQRELPSGYVFTAAYVGRRGLRLYRSWDANQIDAKPILPSFLAMQKNVAIGAGCRPDGTLANGSPCAGASPVPLLQQGIANAAFVNSAATQTDLSQNAAGNFAGRLEQSTLLAGLRPNPQFAQILIIDNGGDSNYHAGQFTVRKRFDRTGLLMNAAYTVSKSIDVLSIDPVLATVGGGLTTTSSRTPVDGRNYRNERARSDFDQRHVFSTTSIYELPLGRGKKFFSQANSFVNTFLGGWSINGIYTYQSGEPFSVRSGVLTANFTSQSRAALKPGVALPQSQLQNKAGAVGPVYFPNADAFTFPNPGDVGLGRNVFQGPSYWDLDAGITKGFQITERVKMVFRTELFNALNHPNFRNPRDASSGTPAITSGLFGQACCITLSTASSATTNQNGESWRIVQFALKLSF
ncbi:MAG: carboxypeptidase regulatory-like domain-containing protein [Candidatus Solibacter usitatus]|nr:carboxypeptidase regulatory-like domain-containing protein [Candidatus Solibacter usitatus]